MVNKFNEQVFVVLSSDYFWRKNKIEDIKKKLLVHNASLNTLTFYSQEIELKDFKEKIFTFSFNKNKLVIIKDALYISQDIKEFISKNLEKIILNFNYFLFEIEVEPFQFLSEKKLREDKFFNFLFGEATIFKYLPSYSTVSLMDFKRSLRRGNLALTLYNLEKLFTNKPKEFGNLIIGVLIKEFSFLNSSYRREEYLKYLWDLDRAVKEKGIEPILALEIFLTKIFIS